MEVRFDARGQLLDCRGFGQAWRTFDQQVTIGKQGNQQSFDQRLLADNALLQFSSKPGKRGRGRCRFGHVHDFCDELGIVTVALQRVACDSTQTQKLPRLACSISYPSQTLID